MTNNQYAIAIYELAKEDHNLKAMEETFAAFMEIYNNNEEFYQVFNSPRVKASDKKEIIKNAFKNCLVDFTYFLNVVIDNNREAEMKTIYSDFCELLNEAYKVKEVRVVSKEKLSNDELNKIRTNLETIFQGYNVEIKNELDEKIIGGYLIYSDNKLLDLSLKGKLDNLKASL